MKAKVGRREFLKTGGIVTAGAAVGLGLPLLPAYRSTAVDQAAGLSGKRWGMVIDVTKCRDGCTKCVEACRRENNVALHGDPKTDIYWIRKAKISRKVENARVMSAPLLCNQCDHPPCALVCPVQATYRRADGVVLVDAHRCIGCRYCVIACPYDMRMFNFEENRVVYNEEQPVREHGVSESCNFCFHRVDKGMQPACVEVCGKEAEGAMVFGDLNDPSSEVSKLIAKSQVRALREDLGTKPKVYYMGL